MQDSLARQRRRRSTRKLTLAEVLDPATFTRSRRRFGAIKSCAPYCLHEIHASTDLLAVDRAYHPVGAGIPADVWVDYADPAFARWRFERGELRLDAAPDSVWLWAGSTAPYASAENLAAYRLRLLDVFGTAGLARLAALVGRELGVFPDRAACVDAVQLYGCRPAASCSPDLRRALRFSRGLPDGSAQVRCRKRDSEEAICATAVGDAQARRRTLGANGEPAPAPLKERAVPDRTQLRIWIPDVLAQRLHARATEAQTSVRRVVLDALDRHLDADVGVPIAGADTGREPDAGGES